MAPKKSKKTGLVERPNAKKVSGLDYEYDPLKKTTVATKEEPLVEKEASEKSITFVDEDMDPETGVIMFILNSFDRNVNTRHVFQFFILLFLANVTYLWYKGKSEEWALEGSTGADPMESLIIAVCVLMITVLEFFAIINSKFKAWKAKVKELQFSEEEPSVIEQKKIELSKEKPSLPSFNYIYSIFIPLLLTLILAPQYLILVAICAVQISEMHGVIRGLISYVVILQFFGFTGSQTLANVTSNVTSASSADYFKVPILCSLQHEAFNKFLGASVPAYEKTLLVTASTFLLSAPNLMNADLTIVIMKNLYASLTIATYIAFGIYWLYRYQSESSLKYFLNLLVYIVFIGTFVVASDKLLYPVVNKFPLNWVKDFILENEFRVSTFQVWGLATCIIIPTAFVLFIKLMPSIALDVKRKIWHFVLFFMILVPLVHDPQLVSIALFGIAGLLIVIEIVRANDIPPFGARIESLFNAFLDTKDQVGDWATSYIYLVLGFGAPLWLTNLDISKETSYLGLVTLGFGDAFASIIGRRYGSYKWPDSEKTIEGTLAFIAGSCLGLVLVDYFTSQANIHMVGCSWVNRMVLVGLVAAFESFVDVNDNLYVPIFAAAVEEVLLLFL